MSPGVAGSVTLTVLPRATSSPASGCCVTTRPAPSCGFISSPARSRVCRARLAGWPTTLGTGTTSAKLTTTGSRKPTRLPAVGDWETTVASSAAPAGL